MWKLILMAACAAVVGCAEQEADEPKVLGDRETCATYCSRYIECKDASIAPSVEACTNDCIESLEWSGPCAEEMSAFMECATLPKHACPTFEHVGLNGELAPCYDENEAYSICFNNSRP